MRSAPSRTSESVLSKIRIKLALITDPDIALPCTIKYRMYVCMYFVSNEHNQKHHNAHTIAYWKPFQ